MANVNIKVLIKTPTKPVEKLVFQEVKANDVIVIPHRTAYTDIVNYDDLEADGVLRAGSKVVGDYGGGLRLPRTEKMYLLLKAKATDTITLTITGNKRLGIADETITITTPTIGDIFEVDLFDFGTMINDGGNVKITTDKAVDAVLVARF